VGKVLRLDQQGRLTAAAAILLALITLFTSYDHIVIPGAGAALHLPQQAGIPLLAAAVAAAFGEAQLASDSRAESAEIRARAESDRAEAQAEATRRGRAKAQCTLAILEFVDDPTPAARRRLRDVIALIREYPEIA
jgi:hypothetical protein